MAGIHAVDVNLCVGTSWHACIVKILYKSPFGELL